jgi:hypothetical protein
MTMGMAEAVSGVLASERKPLTVYGLVRSLEDFSSDNERSPDVNLRWLAAQSRVLLDQARRFRNDTLTDEEKAAASLFRLDEIEREKARRLREIEELDREAAKLKVA